MWDYRSGEVVCSGCGLVHDRLTSFELAIIGGSTKGEHAERCRRAQLTRPEREISSSYTSALKLYRSIGRLTRGKPWLEVDYLKLLRVGKFVGSIKSRTSLKAVKNIELAGFWEEVQRGLKYIDSANPAYLARTDRAKYALAYMVARRLETGMLPDQDEVVRVFNISSASYKRLRVIAERLALTRMARELTVCSNYRLDSHARV